MAMNVPQLLLSIPDIVVPYILYVPKRTNSRRTPVWIFANEQVIHIVEEELVFV